MIVLFATAPAVALTAPVESTPQILQRPTLWTLRADGKKCGEVDTKTRAMLAAWKVDAENTVAEEGVFGLYNPEAPSQLVVLFTSKRFCEEITGELRESQALPPQIAWGKTSGGLRVGIAVTRTKWPTASQVVFQLIVQNTSNGLLTIEEPRVVQQRNVRLWLDGEEHFYRGPRIKIRSGWRPRKTDLDPGEQKRFELSLRPFVAGGKKRRATFGIRLAYNGLRSGKIAIEIQ